MASARLQHLHVALHRARPALAPVAAAADGSADSELPVVAIIDMENKDGTIYSGAGDDTIELHELEGTATVRHACAASPGLRAHRAVSRR